MARIRTIKPAAFSSESLAAVSVEARWTFAGLWTFVDDDGRGKATLGLIKAHVWPLDDVSLDDVDSMLRELEREDMIHRYEVDGRSYLQVVNWAHQKISHPTPSVIPPEPTEPSPSPTDETSGSIPEPSVNLPEPFGPDLDVDREVDVEGIGSRSRAKGARLPDEWTPDSALIEQMRTEGIPDDVARRELVRFRDYWAGVSGSKGVKLDWPATWRNWLRRANDERGGRAGPARAQQETDDLFDRAAARMLTKEISA